jgi:hypothetical protein
VPKIPGTEGDGTLGYCEDLSDLARLRRPHQTKTLKKTSKSTHPTAMPAMAPVLRPLGEGREVSWEGFLGGSRTVVAVVDE